MKIINTNKISRVYFIIILAVVFSLSAMLVEAGGGGGKKGGCNPSPPPACAVRTGCYNKADQHVDFGSLAPDDFGSYYGVNACIKATVSTGCGGSAPCNCVSGTYVDDAKETNPDSSSGACNCIAGTSWDAKGKCCGNDANDCGRTSIGVLCSIDANAQSANWIASSPNLGDIRYVGCSGSEFLSDGTNWRKCDGNFWRQNIGNDEYICVSQGHESIVECCGDSSCKSKIDGKRLSTGQSAAAQDGKTYYCTPSGKFTTDLDADQTGITKANRKSTCEKAGFVWTGTKCCSEDDDPNEYYNDPNGVGGCWNKKAILSVNFVGGTDNSVVNDNGEFHGCSVDKQNFNKNNDNLLNIIDSHSHVALIINHDYCFNDPEKNYYCSYTEKWLPTEGSDRTHLTFAPVAKSKQAAECCSQDECWDGEKCTENQIGNPLAQPINGLRCIDGEWTSSEPKTNPDDSVTGFCPKKTQCLVNAFGKNESSQCIDTERYVEDNYCENGTWSSRTKLLALKLLKIKSGDFILFCDNRDNALNNLQYLTGSGEIVANVISNLQTNNFCVLKSGSRIIAATSINKNLENVPSNSLNIFGVTNCNNALTDDGQYHSCDASNKVWFNKRLKSFIYSSSAINVPPEEKLTSFIKDIIKNIVDSIKRLIISPPFDESYLKGLKKFNKLYMAEQTGKSIMGSIEGKSIKNAVIQYSGFNTDICKFVEQFNQAKKDASSGLSCKNENSNYFVLAQGSQLSNLDPESIWPDLTSKLRIK